MSEQRKSLLVLRTDRALRPDQRLFLREQLATAARGIDAVPLLVEDGMDVELHDLGPLADAIQRQTDVNVELSQSIMALATSNMELVQAMAEAEEHDEGDEPEFDLAGRPIK